MENKNESLVTNFYQNIFKQDSNGLIRMIFYFITICVFAICLTLYLCGYGDAQQAILQNNGFTSAFIYKLWFVIPLLCITFICLWIILKEIKVFDIYVVILLFAIFIMFGWTFADVYFILPNKSSKTTQTMAIITISLTAIFAILLMYRSNKPILSLLLLIPLFFFEVLFIYVGGVQGGEWQNF
jgi:hypothetical protein